MLLEGKKIIELQTGAITEVKYGNVNENFGIKICGSEMFKLLQT